MATVQRKVILQSITDEVTGVTTHRYEGTDIATWLREHRRAIEEAGKT